MQMEWVNGSFVTAKHAPNDLDVTTFIALANMAALSIDDRKAVSELTEGTGPQQVGCHSFLVILPR